MYCMSLVIHGKVVPYCLPSHRSKLTHDHERTGKTLWSLNSNETIWHGKALTCGNMSPVRTAAYTVSCRPNAKYAATAIWVTSIVPTVIHLATSGPKATGKLFKPIFLQTRAVETAVEHSKDEYSITSRHLVDPALSTTACRVVGQ